MFKSTSKYNKSAKSGNSIHFHNNERNSAFIQRKLKIGKPNNHYEQEANRVADKVVSDKEPSAQRQCSGEENMMQMKSAGIESITPIQRQLLEEEEEEMLQPKLNRDQTPWIQRQEEEEEEAQPKEKNGGIGAQLATPWVENSIRNARGSGNPLPKDTGSFMENRFGANFENIRVHTNDRAAQMNDQINAQAFTSGNDIFFNRGKYSPETQSGKRLLAHELTHTIQQGATSSPRQVQREYAVAPVNPANDSLSLTTDQVRAAIRFNQNRFFHRGELAMLRDVIGLSRTPTRIDSDFVNAIAQYQHQFGLTVDGKVGPRTARTLTRELGAERQWGDWAQMAIRNRSTQSAPNITVNGSNNLFDADLDHRNARLTLRMRVRFNFVNGTGGAWSNTAAQITWRNRFVSRIHSRWSYKLLMRRIRHSRRYLRYYATRIRIDRPGTTPHFTATVSNDTSHQGSSVSRSRHTATLDSYDTRYRSRVRGGRTYQQRGAEHEFGHMLGLNHIACNSDADACYGGNHTERNNIMGVGSRVTTDNAAPFLAAMQRITSLTWQARPYYTL